MLQRTMAPIWTTALAKSPTILRKDGFRLLFFPREEPRPHVHVTCADGEAKFWLEPKIELAQNWSLDRRKLRAAEALIRENEYEIRSAWRDYFGN